MTFYLFGIDYKSASIDVREDLYRRREEIRAYWENINPGRTAILTTCNRIEIYGTLEYPHEIEEIRRHHKLASTTEAATDYLARGRKSVFTHGLRLACGLESELLGESQILQQLHEWSIRDDFPIELHVLWNTILATARHVRKVSGLNETAVNVGDAVFNDLSYPAGKKQVMVIGTGRLAELIARRKPEWVNITFVARKKREKIRTIANAINADILPLSGIRKSLTTMDAVISATSSPHYILRKEHFQGLHRTRKNPLRVYDLAVPRDVDPEAADIDSVEIIGLGEVSRQFNQHNGWLRQRLEIAEQLTEEVVNEYTQDSYRVAI